MVIKYKSCTKCNISKPETEYYVSRKEQDGLQYRCKACCRTQAKEWQDNNKERKQKIRTIWYYSNQEYNKKRSLEWYYENHKEAKKRNLNYYHVNKGGE